MRELHSADVLAQQRLHLLLLPLLAKGLFAALTESPAFSSLCHPLLERGHGGGGTLGLGDWQGMLMPAATSQLVLSGKWVCLCLESSEAS